MDKLNILKLIVIIALIISVNDTLYAQKEIIEVTGTMNNSKGEPIPGISILIEGTTNGTITNIDGNYKLKAPIGSTLIISFVGMKTIRATVTRTGLNPIGSKKIIPYNNTPQSTRFTKKEEQKNLKDSITYNKRIKLYKKYLNDTSTLSKYDIIEAKAEEINKSNRERTLRKIKNIGKKKFLKIGDIDIETSVSIHKVGKTPLLQQKYAQGRPIAGKLTHQYANEIFSWGPPLRNLEYDGIANNYSSFGTLVPLGEGVGKSAIAYNSKNIFKTGHSKYFGIKTHMLLNNKRVTLSYKNQSNKGILSPINSNIDKLSFSAQLPLDINIKASYGKSHNNFNDGMILSGILKSAYLTPPSFNNKNESELSFSPGKIYNPYVLSEIIKDKNQSQSLLYNLQKTIGWNNGSIFASLSGESFNSNKEILYPNQALEFNTPQYLIRKQKADNYFSVITLTQYLFYHKLRFVIPTRGEFRNYKLTSKYNHHDDLSINRSRNIITTTPQLKSNYYNLNDIFKINIGANTYTSNTTSKSYIYPNIEVKFCPFEFFDKVFWWNTKEVINSFILTYKYHKQPNEYDLISDFGTGASLQLPSANADSYFVNTEIDINDKISPEIVSKSNFNIETNFLHGRLSSTTSFYSQKRESAIFPIFNEGKHLFNNVADIKSQGWENSIHASLGRNSFKWNGNLSLSKYKTKVSNISEDKTIAISGFKDVFIGLVNGKSSGVIIGSAYKRNSEGKKIIDSYGFPIVDENLKIIGDPTPDLQLGFTNSFNIKTFEVGFTFDCVFGGDVWNGTQAVLDYHGASELTAKQRSITDYIFDGVTESGAINTLPVNFASINNDITENKWVRYGETGVAEEYIEDATRIVLNELYVSYSFPKHFTEKLNIGNLSIVLSANNLVTISGYNGNLPSGTLWGNSNAFGLDYFNAPTLRKYSATVKITL